jgi:hypothetical protein
MPPQRAWQRSRRSTPAVPTPRPAPDLGFCVPDKSMVNSQNSHILQHDNKINVQLGRSVIGVDDRLGVTIAANRRTACPGQSRDLRAPITNQTEDARRFPSTKAKDRTGLRS